MGSAAYQARASPIRPAALQLAVKGSLNLPEVFLLIKLYVTLLSIIAINQVPCKLNDATNTSGSRFMEDTRQACGVRVK